MSGPLLITPSTPRVPVRRREDRQDAQLQLVHQGVAAFLNLNFTGRIKWLLFGVRAFQPKGQPPPAASR